MKAAVPWLAALLCAGWITSNAQAFRILRDIRNRRNGEVVQTDQTPVQNNGGVIVGDQTPAPVTAPVTDPANCPPAEGHRLLGGHGYLHAIPGYLHGWCGRVATCLQNVPGHAPPPPKPFVVNPYLRGPRDYFMLDDP